MMRPWAALIESGPCCETGVIRGYSFDVSEVQTVHAGLFENCKVSVTRIRSSFVAVVREESKLPPFKPLAQD